MDDSTPHPCDSRADLIHTASNVSCQDTRFGICPFFARPGNPRRELCDTPDKMHLYHIFIIPHGYFFVNLYTIIFSRFVTLLQEQKDRAISISWDIEIAEKVAVFRGIWITKGWKTLWI